MADPDLAAKVGRIWSELDDGLWHTTHPERFLSIVADGAILPEPDIPDADRWSTGQGPRLYPYVRHIGGVSLFDFYDFEADTYSEKYKLSSWRTFVPYRDDWDGAVWIQIDREKVAEAVISGKDLLEKQKSSGEIARRIMPIIEAAHIGPLSVSSCTRAILICHSEPDGFLEFELPSFDAAAYAAALKAWKAGVRTDEQRRDEAFWGSAPKPTGL